MAEAVNAMSDRDTHTNIYIYIFGRKRSLAFHSMLVDNDDDDDDDALSRPHFQ